MSSASESWTVVKFLKTDDNEESVEAVPTSWIVDDECLWPPLSGNNLKNAIKKHATPVSNWRAYNIAHFEDNIYSAN